MARVTVLLLLMLRLLLLPGILLLFLLLSILVQIDEDRILTTCVEANKKRMYGAGTNNILFLFFIVFYPGRDASHPEI
jgi:hypothetical protein